MTVRSIRWFWGWLSAKTAPVKPHSSCYIYVPAIAATYKPEVYERIADIPIQERSWFPPVTRQRYSSDELYVEEITGD